MEAIEFDVTKQLDTFNKLANSMDFIISTALNDVAFERGRNALSKEVNQKMTIRNKPMGNKNAIKFHRSTKDKLNVTLYFHLGKKSQRNPLNESMGLQQTGGAELPKGKKLAIPVRSTFKSYMGVPNTKNIPKRLKIDAILRNAPRKNRHSKNYAWKGINIFTLSRGVFIRVDGDIKMLYTFQDKANHNKKLLRFQEATEITYNKNLERYIDRNYKRILKG